MRTDHLFVYGTFKRGGSRHNLIREQLEQNRAEFITDTCVEGFDLYDFGNYPVAVPGTGRIEGEIFEVPHDFLIGKVDQVEGFPHGFDRKKVSIDERNCWIYYKESAPPGSSRIESSNWNTDQGE